VFAEKGTSIIPAASTVPHWCLGQAAGFSNGINTVMEKRNSHG